MRVTDFARGAAWAIVPERFDEISRRFHATEITEEMMLRAEKEGALILKLSDSDSESPLYSLTDEGAAIISIQGPLVKDPFLAWWFDGMTFQQIRAAVSRAMDDPRVAGIVLDVDSPGGTVSGTEETAEAVFGVRGAGKPIAAFSSGMIASAAYWIGSAAERVIVSKTAEAGSIGVLMIHREFSELEKRIGVKTTYLKAGRFKAIGNPSEPLSEDARAIFQGQLDQIYSIFVGSVALYRDVEEERVRADMADGRIFIGERSVAAGLADQVGNIQTAVDWVLSAAENENRASGGYFKMQNKESKIEVKTYDDLKAVGGDILKQAEEAAYKAGAESVDMEPARKEGADQERERVLGIAVVLVGDDLGKKLTEIVKSGVSVEQFKAIHAAAAPAQEKADPKKAEMLNAIVEAGAENPGAGGDGSGGGKSDFWGLVEARVAERKCSRAQAVREIRKDYPDAHAEMLRKANPHIVSVK
jgi:signal peptide peptidase SppA